MRTLQITITGKTDSDLTSGLQEVTRLVDTGMILGFNSNDTGSFRFEIEGEEELATDEDDEDDETA